MTADESDVPIGRQIKLRPSLWERIDAEAARRIIGRHLFIEKAIIEVLEMIEGEPVFVLRDRGPTTKSTPQAQDNLRKALDDG